MKTRTLVEALISNRITKLQGDNDYLTRQIQVKAQRLEDLKIVLKDNLVEIIELKEFLSPIKTSDAEGTELGKHSSVIIG